MSGFVNAEESEISAKYEGSICIVGAGAAGITLARKLLEKFDDVILVESGDTQIDGGTQGLYAGDNLGLDYHNLLACRLRYFGGTTNHWSGFCRDNDPVDYEGRAELGLPEWPVKVDDLQDYVIEAGRILGVDSSHHDPRGEFESRGLDFKGLAEDVSEILSTKIFQHAKDIRFGERYYEYLNSSSKVKGLLNLNLVHIQLNESGDHVDHVVCKTLNGNEVKIKAKAFVLCCHAIENSRMLMVSNDVVPEGIGNEYDHVGRYFMDHIYIHASRFIPSDAFPWMYDKKQADTFGINANLSFTDSFTRNEGLLQYYCRFNPVYIGNDTKDALKDLYGKSMKPGDLEYLADISTVLRDVVGVSKFVASKASIAFIKPGYYDMEHRLEQAPNENSRVRLSSHKVDALGLPVANLDWRLNDHDINSFNMGQEHMALELSALGWGRVVLEDIDRDMVEDRVKGHYHHIGTTRMSSTAKDGVVDSNCLVHGVDNLYIGGSSVFPTAGYSGPTMMIVAFALRLADYIGRKYV